MWRNSFQFIFLQSITGVFLKHENFRWFFLCCWCWGTDTSWEQHSKTTLWFEKFFQLCSLQLLWFGVAAPSPGMAEQHLSDFRALRSCPVEYCRTSRMFRSTSCTRGSPRNAGLFVRHAEQRAGLLLLWTPAKPALKGSEHHQKLN